MDYHGERPTVLVVEDDASLRGLVIHMLTNGGLASLEADTAAKALALVRERDGQFDLAIIDMVMPGVSGLDLAAILGRDYPNLKILYISGYIGSLAAEALARRSPERVLLKPFTEDALLARVLMLLGTASAVSGGNLG